MISIPSRPLRNLATFIVYGLVGNELNAAIIFSGLQFFNVLRMPISQLPMIFMSVVDAVVALRRIGAMLTVSSFARGEALIFPGRRAQD